MYKEIEVMLFSKGMSKADVAKQMGMSYNTFLLKLKGKYNFSLDEAVTLKKILNTEKSIEELFATA